MLISWLAMNLLSTDFEKIFPKPKKRVLMIIVRARISMALHPFTILPKKINFDLHARFYFQFCDIQNVIEISKK